MTPRAATATAAAALALLAAAGAGAQADPMRPLAAAPAGSAASAAAAKAPAAAPAAPRLPALVAIREDSQGRRQALFGERWLEPGDRLEGRTVASIGPHHVELGAGKSRLTLHLLTPLQAAAEPAERRPAPAQHPRGTALVQASRGTGSPTR